MPTSLSAKKRVRQIEKRRVLSRARRSSLRTAMRAVNAAVATGDAGKIETAVRSAYKAIDKAAEKHAIHANTAARRKALVARTARGKAPT